MVCSMCLAKSSLSRVSEIVGASICPWTTCQFPVTHTVPWTCVLEFFLGDLARLGKLGFGASFIGLQACHLVNANSVRIELLIKLWRVQIGLANELDLLLKQFGILLGRVAPILAFVRLEINFSKDSIHVAHGNGINHTTLLRLVGKLLPGPGSHRTTTVFWRFTGDADQAP